jgi:Protein of unknown function (DUF3109)
MASFRLKPLAARWLRAEAPESGHDGPPDWDAWLLKRMSQGEVTEVGPVLVDRAVLRQRFACVSDRCAPGPDRGDQRSCCADTFVSLSRAEDRRLASRGIDLLAWLQAREPRLAQCQGRTFYRAEGELGLARPGGRCVFSQLDEQGRIRCRLHAYAKQAHIDRGELQPVSCRLFPLVVVDRGDGRVLLTVVASHTRRLVSAYPPTRYPCLADTALPPLYESMRADLDWLFGPGFANALARKAQETGD